jgi:hypothetical protein
VEQRKSHMVISVKPFGCMPSSGVSDGVQSLVTARPADAVFCAIETTGDGAVNVQSRVLMSLFKARQKAQQEFDALQQASGRSAQELETLARKRRCAGSLFYPPHKVAGTASNLLLALDPRLTPQAAAPTTTQRQASAPPKIGHARVAFRNGMIPLTPIASGSLQKPGGDQPPDRVRC